MKYYRITPLDTFFFRDGSPLSFGESGQMEVRGIFPPNPTTVAGSLRAAFARQLGWNERSGGWDASIIEKLGDGDDLYPLRFSGLYLTRGGEPLFPAPLHLLRKSEHLTWLKPGSELRTDDGMARLPEVEKIHDTEGEEVRGFKTLEDSYLTLGAMQEVLNGRLPKPDDIVPVKELWTSETRVGIQRDREKGVVKEGMLYQTIHVRLIRGVALVMGVKGYDGFEPGLSTLGGESRMVRLESHDGLDLPKAPDIEPSGGVLRYTATLITPAGVAGRPTDDLPGAVVSACIGKPVMIGGWDGKERRPKALKPHLPAGSVWFMEAPEDEKEEVMERNGTYIGEKTEWGYGQILIGAWE